MTRRRWIADTFDEPPTPGSHATLEGNQAAHLARVLRAQPGTEYEIVTGQRVWQAQITKVSDVLVTFRLLEELQAEETLAITVLLSIFKFDRLEWAIEKLTELGVSSIQPVIARRTEKHLAQASVNRVERWRKIARETAKQSRRVSIPEIGDPQPLKESLRRLADDASSLRLVLAENEKQYSLRSALEGDPSSERRPIHLALGPEGGWTPEEEALFAEWKWTPVTLGPTILRAETAAITAVAVTAAWMNI
jgi:16S rRNA (uracil1498-N3)-methyltransferase